MPNIAKVLKQEISRLARIEVRANMERTRSSVLKHQREIADLKGQIRSLERQVSTLRRNAPAAQQQPAASDDGEARQTRFVPKGVVSMRKRLGLSVADLASLMSVSGQTIYNWERGATRPRPEQREKLAALRRAGKRQVQAHLAQRDQSGEAGAAAP